MKADIIWLDTADSTNDEARRHISDIDNLSVLSVLQQTAGRGQRGNTWSSSPGQNLTFSIVLKFSVPGITEEILPSVKAYDQFVLTEIASVSMVSFLFKHGIDAKIKLLRALEVYYETGETITEHNRRTQAIPPRYNPLWLGLDFADRAELYRRIDLRVDIMLEAGLVEEIRSLLAEGIPPKATALQAIGYKEFVDALEGKSTVAEAAAQVQQSSRRYAKRQLTWFRRNANMHWLTRHPGEGAGEILAKARQVLHETDN